MSKIETRKELLETDMEYLNYAVEYRNLVELLYGKIEVLLDIIEPDIAWIVSSMRNNKIELIYRGEAESEEDARTDLARIMSVFRVIFEDITTSYCTKFSSPHAYSGCYRAHGQIDGIEYILDLLVPWFPEGCTIVKREPEKKWRRETCRPTYSIQCGG
jgi:hypothetical protein